MRKSCLVLHLKVTAHICTHDEDAYALKYTFANTSTHAYTYTLVSWFVSSPRTNAMMRV